ncbi:MAG: ABC transporter permease [Candidatus Caldarchaeum sp.]
MTRVRNPIVFLVAAVVSWELIPSALAIPPYIIPTFSSTTHALLDNLGLIAYHSLSTLSGIGAGFTLAVAIGISLGVAIALWREFRETIYPFLVMLYSTPKIALVPIIIIWMGYGPTPEIAVVMLASFFPVLVNTIVGFDNIQPELIELVRTMTGDRLKEVVKVRLPYSVPHILAGLKVGITQAVIGKIVAEFVIGQSGLGFMMIRAQSTLNTPVVFATLLMLVILALTLYLLMIGVERMLTRWRTASETVLTQ